MQTLLIYEEIPESCELYLIPDAPEWLRDCHGLYMNVTELTDAQIKLMTRVGDAISSRLEHCDDKKDPLATKWAALKVDPTSPVTLTGDIVVVHCGFML